MLLGVRLVDTRARPCSRATARRCRSEHHLITIRISIHLVNHKLHLQECILQIVYLQSVALG
jgi:hypothetical protein